MAQVEGDAEVPNIRAKRFALYAEDGVVKQLFVEAPGEFKVSSAENVLANL